MNKIVVSIRDNSYTTLTTVKTLNFSVYQKTFQIHMDTSSFKKIAIYKIIRTLDDTQFFFINIDYCVTFFYSAFLYKPEIAVYHFEG